MSEDARQLTPTEVAYYRKVLQCHQTAADTGLCPVCAVPRCPDWRNAFDRLAFAGETMSAPDTRWQDLTGGRESGCA